MDTATEPGAQEAHERPDPPSTVLQRGLLVLEAVARSANRRGVGVTAISAETGLDKSTASRLLAQLREAGYVRQDGYRRYRLTAKLSELGAGYSEVEDLRVVARRHLEVMHERFDEEIHLAVLDGGLMTFIDYIGSSQLVRSHLTGRQRPVHETAAGRAILAHLPHETRVAVLHSSAEGEGQVLSDEYVRATLVELDEARDRGWAGYDRADDVIRYASAVFSADGEPVAAACISGPSFRLLPQGDAVAAAVIEAAAATSRDLAGENH
ncbi:IclR family transcriptional regulator [Pseudonocardia sp. ICBG1293]|uniref:IclR family transcriptional regulator n=1 Tax=Pseudonocardia sp. ICBG1293 TaxID=2844382 RepID=UPI001CCB3EE9|nr:IclR family transcriptional regulator [Pseudonocardia sp. ICBG1293]